MSIIRINTIIIYGLYHPPICFSKFNYPRQKMKRSLLSDCFIPQIIPTEIALESDVPTVECTVDTVKKSLGSSFVSIGQTKVICTVAGPRANQKAGSSFSDAGILECEVRCVQCSVNFDTTPVQNLERQLSNSVKNALESAVRRELRGAQSCLDSPRRSLHWRRERGSRLLARWGPCSVYSVRRRGNGHS